MAPVSRLQLPAGRERLSDAIYETLLEAIIAGDLPSGTVMSEVTIARDLGVSRTPVHDALRLLASDGLVDRPLNRRARVAEFTRDDVFEMFEMRRLLEGRAAELAAVRMDRRHLRPLRLAHTRLVQATRDKRWLEMWTDGDEKFHEVIAQSCGLARLSADISRYRLLHRGLNKSITDVELLQPALEEHGQILDALEAADATGARHAMVAHIEVWQDYFVESFPR